MALTKPKLSQNIDTDVSVFSDPILVLHQGSTSANLDVGFLMNRSNGLTSNAAVIWQESTRSFVYVLTNDSGASNSNLNILSYANVTVGNITANVLYTYEGIRWAANGNPFSPGGGGSGGVFTASNTAPVSPNPSDFWYKISEDILFQYIDDGTSDYWVDVQSQTLFANTAGTVTELGETTITGNLIPTANVTYNIGSSALRFKDIFLSGNTIDLGGAVIKSDSDSGAFAFIPLPTAASPNPTALIFTPTGTITTVNTVGGVITDANIGAASNTASESGETVLSNVTATGNIVAANITANSNVVANKITTTVGIFWSNGSAFLSEFAANVGAYQTFSNANAATQATAINTINANIGAYQTNANANVVAIQANLGAYQTYANANVVAIQANLGAYQTYANTKIGTNSDSNLVVVSTTTSTSTTTGALVVGGGVGIVGNLNVGGPSVISVNSANDALRITQVGTGNALVVEDSANPDASPFVVSTDGYVRLNGSTNSTPLNIIGNAYGGLSIEANDSSADIQITRASDSSGGPFLYLNKARGTISALTAITTAGDDYGTINFRGYHTSGGNAYKTGASIIGEADTGTYSSTSMPGRLVFSTTADGASSPTERMRIDNIGNFSLGPGGTISNQRVRLGGNFTQGTTGTGYSFGFIQAGTVQSDVTNLFVTYRSETRTAAASFTLGNFWHFQASQATIGAGSAITGQIGFLAESTLTGATNNFGFYSDLASGTGRWNFYAAGTADNYFAGSVGIGNTAPVTSLSVTGTTYTSGNINTAGQVIIQNSTASASTTSGALVVAGGAGIAGNVYAGALYDNGSRTATTGKAIAMSIVFGG